MKENYYLIDRIARELGVTKRTIRYYEEQGLLSPPNRTEKGYRLYSESDLNRLRLAIEMRDIMGFSLNDIKEILTLEDTVAGLCAVYKQDKNSKCSKAILMELKKNLTLLLDLIAGKKSKLERMEASYRKKLNGINGLLKEFDS